MAMADKDDYPLLSLRLQETVMKVEIQEQEIEHLKKTVTDQESKIQELILMVKDLKLEVEKTKTTSKNGSTNTATVTATTGWGDDSKPLSELVKETAEQTLATSGFVFDEASGLYFDYASGYYYDPNQKLYYNGHTGVYYTFDETKKEYIFHSKIDLQSKNQKPRSRDYADKKQKKRKKEDSGSENTEISARVATSEGVKSSRHKTRLSSSSPSNHLVDDERKHKSKDKVTRKVERSCEKSTKCEKLEEMEEGEISSDDNECAQSPRSITSSLDVDTSDSHDSIESVRSPGYPPCIRAVVSEVPESCNNTSFSLKRGFLFIVTCSGGTIGRQGSHHVILLPHANVSRKHAAITYDEEQRKYFIADLGSQCGTILNGVHLSGAESEPHEIVHGSKVQIGEIKLLLHIHEGSQTCGHCEPGLLLEKETAASSVTTVNKEAVRKGELNKLKKKYNVGRTVPQKLAELPPNYKNRAEERRIKKGSDNPYEKTEVASNEESIRDSNKGFKMLKKMGWEAGNSLGQKDGSGLKEPIKVALKTDRSGLGSGSAGFL